MSYSATTIVLKPSAEFYQRHPWQVIDPNSDKPPQRFSNELCAAHSVYMAGPNCRNWRAEHAITRVKFNWHECAGMVNDLTRAQELVDRRIRDRRHHSVMESDLA